MGITAKRTEAINATVIPYLLSVILKTNKVSRIAKIPTNNLGTKCNDSIDCRSDDGFSMSGYPIRLSAPAKNICPK
jgi:hypothetical protein